MKTCTSCRTMKAFEEFYRSKHSPDGYQYTCKDCQKALNRTSKRIRQRRANQFSSLYRFHIDDYDYMFDQQDGRCAICGTTDPGHRRKYLSVDHDHKRGIVRGLLCQPCNIGLGKFEDQPDRLRKAAEYLESPPIVVLPEASGGS